MTHKFADRVKVARDNFVDYGGIYWYQHCARELMELAEEMSDHIITMDSGAGKTKNTLTADHMPDMRKKKKRSVSIGKS